MGPVFAYNLLTFLLCAIVYTDAFSIQILQSSPLTISTGRDLTLTCYPVDVSMFVPLEWWTPDGSLVTVTDQGQRRYVQFDPNDPRKVQLIVRAVQVVDAGNYVCKYNPGIDNAGQFIQKSITVNVMQQLSIVDCNNYQYLIYGERKRMIVCVVIGNPAPVKYWWYSPKTSSGNPSGVWTMLQSSAKHAYMNNGLEVNDITYADAGWYRMQATIESIGESLIVDIDVAVDTKPTVTGPITFIAPFDIPADGYDLWIQCKGVSGDPFPVIYWYWNNRFDEALTQDLSPRYYSDENTGLLQIKQLNVYDAGRYTCRASSRNGFADYNYELTVIKRPQVIHYLNITADVNANVQLICEITGSAPIEILMWKTGDAWTPGLPSPYVIGTQPDDPRVSFSVTANVNPQNFNQYTAVLNIARVQITDTANYSCIGRNAGGNTTQNGSLIVMDRPRMFSDLQKIGVGYAGNSTNLTCMAYGWKSGDDNDDLEWRWYRRQAGIERGTNDTFETFLENYGRYTKSILQIRVRYTDEWFIYDLYTCNVSSKYGRDGHEIFFHRAQPADPPTVTIVDVTSSSVKFQIKEPTETGGTWITGYQVTYHSGDTWRPAIWYPIEEFIEIQYLSANQYYTFQISALNPVGPGKAAVVTFTTHLKRVPYPCVIISPLTGEFPHSYTVRWVTKGSGGSPITLYLVKLRPISLVEPLSNVSTTDVIVSRVLGDWTEFRVPADPMLSEFIIRNLEADQYYQVQVLAQNAYGFSEPSLSVFKTNLPHPHGRGPFLYLAASSLAPALSALLLVLVSSLYSLIR